MASFAAFIFFYIQATLSVARDRPLDGRQHTDSAIAKGTIAEAVRLHHLAPASQAADEANLVGRSTARAAHAGVLNVPAAGQQVVVAGLASTVSALAASASTAPAATSTVVANVARVAQSPSPVVQASLGNPEPLRKADVPGHVADIVPSVMSRLSGLIAMIAGFSFVAIVKALCALSSLLVQISPLPQVWRWESRLCTAEADPAPYLTICFGGFQWCYYGLFAYLYTGRNGFLILVQSNVLGASLGVLYMYSFWKNCTNEEKRAKLTCYLNFVYGFVFLQLCTLAAFPRERALYFAGLSASLCTFLSAMSTLATAHTMIEAKNSSPIPGLLVLANFSSSVVWCICGWILGDPLVMVPNVFGVMASGLCIYLKALFPDEVSGLGVERQMLKAAPKTSEATPLTRELVTVRPRSSIGPPKEELFEEVSDDDDGSSLLDGVYVGTGGTW